MPRGGRNRKFLGFPGGNARGAAYARGLVLPPLGSIADRVLREAIYRERQEKVAQLDAIGKMVARIFNLDAERNFGGIVADYAAQVFQEMYDLDLLRAKVTALKEAQRRIHGVRTETRRMMDRLERMGEFYDREYGTDLKPKPRPAGKSSR